MKKGTSRAYALNALEKSIIKGVCDAQKKHKALTGGWWLWHGPESFLQVVIAQHINNETGHQVYVDTSISKIQKETGRGPGQPAKNRAERPDISVWAKSSNGLRAIIEVKRSASVVPIRSDAEKLEKLLKQKNVPVNTAYILVYSECTKKKGDTLSKRFEFWKKDIKWKPIREIIVDDSSDSEWKWGFILMRKDMK